MPGGLPVRNWGHVFPTTAWERQTLTAHTVVYSWFLFERREAKSYLRCRTFIKSLSPSFYGRLAIMLLEDTSQVINEVEENINPFIFVPNNWKIKRTVNIESTGCQFSLSWQLFGVGVCDSEQSRRRSTAASSLFYFNLVQIAVSLACLHITWAAVVWFVTSAPYRRTTLFNWDPNCFTV